MTTIVILLAVVLTVACAAGVLVAGLRSRKNSGSVRADRTPPPR